MTEKGGISACSPPRKREAFGHDTVVMLPLHNKYLQITMNYRVQDEHWCGDIPRKHAHCAPAAPIARVRLRNFCLTAKDRASSPLDGLLRNIPTPARPGYSNRGNGLIRKTPAQIPFAGIHKVSWFPNRNFMDAR